MRLIDANKVSATIEQLGNLKGRTDMVTQEWARGWDAAVTMVGKIIEDATTIDDAWLRDTHTAIKNAQIMAMLAIQKAKSVPQWIPVTERLPEETFTYESYLVTLDGELVGQKEPFTGTCGFISGEWDERDSVLAWMPLPEPWDGSDESAVD